MFTSFRSKIQNYASLVKFSHTIFAMPFALLGFSSAILYYDYPFAWTDLIFVIICMVLARNAAMGFNRLIDAQIDKKNPRTANREIPAGKITKKSATLFVTINSLLFIGICYFINPLVFALSPVALVIVLFYSYTKRFTSMAHYFLGLALAISPTAAFIVVSSKFELLPILISILVFFWTAGFDIIYALQDENFDKDEKLHSIPSRFGIKKSLIISSISHAIVVAIVILIGIKFLNNITYWIGSSIFTGLLIYQHIIVKPNDISKVNLAFGTTNGIASVIYGVMGIICLLLM